MHCRHAVTVVWFVTTDSIYGLVNAVCVCVCVCASTSSRSVAYHFGRCKHIAVTTTGMHLHILSYSGFWCTLGFGVQETMSSHLLMSQPCWQLAQGRVPECLVLAHAMVSYLGVTCPRIRGKRSGWVAQNRKARLWKSGFATAAEAAAWLAEGLGVAVEALHRHRSSMPMSPPTPLAVSHYHGVVARKRPAGVLYEARVSNIFVQTFTSEVDAAKVVAKCLGVPVRKLKKKRVFTRRLARQVFCATYSTFKRYFPGDLQHLLWLAKRWASEWQQEPTLSTEATLFWLTFPCSPILRVFICCVRALFCFLVIVLRVHKPPAWT